MQKKMLLGIKAPYSALGRFILPVTLLVVLVCGSALASPLDMEIIRVITNDDGSQSYSLSLQILLVMTALSVLPALLLSCTAFTRVIIVLSLLRQALGTAQTPPNQVLTGVALFITFVVMQPVFNELYIDSVGPFLNEEIQGNEAIEHGKEVMSKFMLANIREVDLIVISDLVGVDGISEGGDAPFFSVIMPAFLISELRTAFEIGFLLFIPFLVIDLVVASILMALGMMMLSPMLVALPFKLLLFITVDGWAMTVGSLVRSFGPIG